MSKLTNPARVRFAPSPTGLMHIGSARTALYDYLIAKQSGGSFILRIEDTDQKRYQESSEDDINTGLNWLGIPPDEGPKLGGPHKPYLQSERVDIYQKHAKTLIKNGHAYYCFCKSERLAQVREEQLKQNQTPHYDGTCRNLSLEEANQRIQNEESHVVRFKSPKEGQTTVHDLLRGDITVENSTLDDIILI